MRRFVLLSVSLTLAVTLVTSAGAREREERQVRVYRLAPAPAPAPAALPTPPQSRESYAPAPDAPASPPEYWEFTFGAGPRTFEARTDTVIMVPKGTALALSNMVGDISVESWKKNAVRLRAQHARRDRFVLSIKHGVLTIEAVNRRGLPPFVDYDLVVPEWMALRLSGIETDIRIDGMDSAVQAECMRGDITVTNSEGPLQLSSIEGSVMVTDAHDVSATSINNNVQLERIGGQIEVESVNGDIRLGEVRSGDVQASSMTGSVVFSGAFQPRGRYRLTSHTGNLQVGVPVNAQVDVSVASYNGAFQSSFPLQVGRQRNGRRFNFTLGTGGSLLELESFQGLIQLMRPGALGPAQPAKAPKPPKAQKAPRAPQTPARPEGENR